MSSNPLAVSPSIRTSAPRRLLSVSVCLLFVFAASLVFLPRSHAQIQPPPTPTGVTAVAGTRSITVSWNASSGADNYTVCATDQPDGSNIICVMTSATSYLFQNLLNNHTYYYYVLANKNFGYQSPPSSTVSATTPSLGTPSLNVTPGKAKFTISWSAVAEAAYYVLCRANQDGSNQTCGNYYNTTSIEMSGNNGVTYRFWILARNDGGDSVPSPTIYAALSLAAPAGLTAKYDSGHTQVSVSWGAVPDADSYVVVRSLSTYIPSPYPGWDNMGTYTATSFVDTYSYSGVRYYQVVAQNSAGQGLKSLVVSTDGRVFPCSPHAACSVPWDKSSGGVSGPARPDPVNLATGAETYAHEPDLVVYNPNGPQVSWQRQYQSYQAVSGYASPGLSLGWTHSYDQFLRGPSTAGTWSVLTLNYSNGAAETLTPVLDGSGQPTGAFTAPAGVPYFAQGVPGASTGSWQSVTVTWKDQTQWRFTPLSSDTYALTQITNRTGQGVTLAWSGARALTQVSDSGSGAPLLSLSYGGDGRLASVSDAYNRQISYGYTAPTSPTPGLLRTVSQVVSIGTPNPPASWTYSYSALGQLLTSVTVPSPTGSGTSTATLNYDSLGRVTSLVDANGNQRVFTYNVNSTQVQVKDSTGAVVQAWTQNFSGQLDTGVTDANNHSTVAAYGDANNPNRPTSVTDKNGKVTAFTYDQYGNVLTTTTPRNVTTTYTYSYTAFPLGRLVSVQEGTKPATTLAYYEPSGLVQSVTRPSPAGSGTVTTSFTYDALGNVLTVTGPGNNAASQITTTYNYTSDGVYTQAAQIGQPLAVVDNLGHTTHLRYDALGRVTSATDALGYETDASYNLAGQIDTVTLPATGQTGAGHGRRVNAYLYPGGPRTAMTLFDEGGAQVRQVTYAYGAEGEMLSVSGSTEPVIYTYDALYRLKTLKDGNNNTTTYGYNNVGLVSSVQMPGGETYQFPSYDSAGNLLQRVDGNGVTTNYLYSDAENKLTDIQYPATPSLNVHIGYDSYGRRGSMTDSTGSQSYSYNDLDALISQTTAYTGLAAQTISYTYYPDGSRQSMATPAGGFTYAYDGAGRMTSLTNPFSEMTQWTYYDNRWLHTQQLAVGALATYTYNARGQVSHLLNTLSGSTISDFTNFTYDGAGNRLSYVTNVPGYSTATGSLTYAYDSKDQITRELSGRGTGYDHSFVYDPAGNPTSFAGTSKTYNSNNQQIGSGFAHDANGNPTSYGGAGLAFDPENRPTSFGSALSAAYRGDGLRAWKETPGGELPPQRVYFLYDGALPVLEISPDGGIVSADSGSGPTVNTFGAAGLISRGVPFDPFGGTGSEFYTFDPQGSVSRIVSPPAAPYRGGPQVSDPLTYTAHGQALSSASDTFGYDAQWGYYTDSETGLQLLTNRYYDPGTGRFLTRDPIGYKGGIDLYAYVRNDPANFIDPLGQDLFGIVGGGSGGGAVGGLELLGTASYMAGINTDCGCGDFTTGGAFSSGLAAGPYGLPAPDERHEPTNGGLGATLGGGGGLFLSNAGSFSQLQGTFDTTIISTPWYLGAEIDTSGDLYVVSITVGKGWGGGVFHMKTYTPPSSTWETKCVPHKQRPKEYWDTHSWGGGGRGW